MVQVAILGFGVVGKGVYELVQENQDTVAKQVGAGVNIGKVLVRTWPTAEWEQSLFTQDFQQILNDSNIRVVVEAMGGLDPALAYTKALLEAGKHVVTSNKELVAVHGEELEAVAQKHGVRYLYEASVGGGIPIIRPLQQCLAANEITEIYGILNGTTNYILTQMKEKGQNFDDALKSAQERGYAEADPTADVEGHDTQRKISILASLAFGTQVPVDSISTKGISALTVSDLEAAENDGQSIKLIGHAKLENGQVVAKVEPMKLSKNSPLANVGDVFNAIVVQANPLGEVMFYGQGAGAKPTASAVMADVIHIAKDIA